MKKPLLVSSRFMGFVLALLAVVGVSAAANAQDYYDMETPEGLRFHILSEEDKTCELVYNPDIFYPGDIVIPDTVQGYTVTTLAQYAFYACSQCTSVVIPSTVTTIMRDVFVGTGISEINLSKNVTKMYGGTFQGNNKLKAINVEDGNPNYASLDGVLYTADMVSLLLVPSQCTGNNGYLALPETVRNLANNAFESCVNLTEVVIPDAVSYMEASMFYECKNLRKVNLPSGVNKLQGCTFLGCESLESIVIPETYTAIDFSAFQRCKSLKTVTIPDAVEYIDFNAFRECSSLETVNLGKGVKSLGGWIFSDCTSLKSLTFPASLEAIGEAPFEGCTSLESLSVEDGSQFFYNLGEGLVTKERDMLVAYPFAKAAGDLVLPEGIAAIGSDVFKGSAIVTVKIPNSVRLIDGSFPNCNDLVSVDLGAGVDTIQYCSFYNCPSLSKVLLPASVKYLGKYAFAGTTELTELTCLATEPPVWKESYDWDDNIYFNQFTDDAFANAVVKVPAESLEAYKVAMGWEYFQNIEGVAGVTDAVASAADAEWFTLAGVKLSVAPVEAGLYLCRTAEGVKKITVK